MKINKTLVKELDKVRLAKKGLRSYLLLQGYSQQNIEKTLAAYKKTY